MKRKNVLITIIVIVLVVGIVLGIFVLKKTNEYNNQISSMYISVLPTKTEYEINEQLDLTGLKLLVILNNGEQKSVPLADCTITGFNSEKAVEMQKIKIEHQGFICSFNVKVK